MKEGKKRYLQVFFLKIGCITVALGIFFAYVSSRYRIGIDDQRHPCLLHHLYVIDLMSSEIEPVIGEAYAFAVRARPIEKNSSESEQPVQERIWAKRLVASEGDSVEITKQGELFVNGRKLRESLPLASLLKKKPEDFAMKRTLSCDEYFFIGDTLTSFDSRYWGVVSKKQFKGKVIFGFF